MLHIYIYGERERESNDRSLSPYFVFSFSRSFALHRILQNMQKLTRLILYRVTLIPSPWMDLSRKQTFDSGYRL